jgi:hypothetical protein
MAVIVIVIVIIIIITIIVVVVVIIIIIPGTSPPEPVVIPTAQASNFSDYSTFHVMGDVPSMAVFCSKSTTHFPGMASKFLLEPFVTTSVTPDIT